jgi:hypothetical protein
MALTETYVPTRPSAPPILTQDRSAPAAVIDFRGILLPSRDASLFGGGRRKAHPSTRRLVSARLSPLLPEPPAAHTGIRLAGRCVALPRLKHRYFRMRIRPSSLRHDRHSAFTACGPSQKSLRAQHNVRSCETRTRSRSRVKILYCRAPAWAPPKRLPLAPGRISRHRCAISGC